MNDNRCEITLITNNMCGIDEGNKFHDFLKMIGVWDKFRTGPYYLLIGILIYDLIWIYLNRKNLSWDPLIR